MVKLYYKLIEYWELQIRIKRAVYNAALLTNNYI